MSNPLRLLTLALLVLCLAIPAVAAPPASPKPQEIAMPEGLAPRYLAWLDEVALLINPQEKAAFAGLQKDYQRDAFIRRFWDVRDPFPQTPVNELRVRWEERAAIARDRFGNLSDDRAHMILFNGEPKEVLRSSCNVLLPVELWSFSETEPIHGTFTLAFVSKGGSPQGPYRLWSPADGIETILSLDLRARIQDPERGLAAIAELCPRGEDLAARLGEALDWHRVETTSHLVPHPSDEWLSTFASYSTDVPEGAPTFPARLDVSFPARFGSRTVVQGVVSVPRTAAVPEKLAGAPEAFYSFLVDGEILLKDELFEHFRYRFTLPVSEATTQEIPVVFQRNLRPGAYGLILKIEDTAGKSYFREQREIEVPTVDSAVNSAAPPVAVAATAPDSVPRSTVATQGALAEANAALTSGDQTIRILSPPAGLVTGKLRMEAVTTGPGVARVRFELDGKPVLTKVRPPFSVELNLGVQPRIHRVRALALDERGNRLAEDEIPLNVGPHRFAVRLTEPQAGKAYQESLRAEAQVEVPDGEHLDRVELYLNDDKLATLYQPPFTQALLLPKGKEVTYVRAVAYLEGGGSTEDLVLVNSPGFNQKLDVQFVELFTSVVDNRGRPVDGLVKGDFKVFEDGAEQQVRRFERVTDVPIYAGILLDTSASMSEGGKLDQAVQGAMGFFDKVITPKDRAAVITFADHPNLAVRFTNQQPLLAGGLAGLTATGNTALYDSLIYALYYFGGVKGKRAIVLLSDGKDEGSHYSYDDVLEYARRSGVAIYTVGIGLSTQAADIRLKLSRLADETGGRFFFIEKARELDGIYDTIQKEVRSQYLLAYQSAKEGGDPDKFRSVEVKMAKPGMEAKTVRGYYP
jgi:Ca-activated chloride channel homolog